MTSPPSRCRWPASTSEKLLLAIAGNSCNANDLAGTHVEFADIDRFQASPVRRLQALTQQDCGFGVCEPPGYRAAAMG